MFKPVEWAFNTSRLCFYIPEGSQKLTVKLLDKSIANLGLYQKGKKLCGRQWVSRQPSGLSNMTFRHLDGRQLTFDDNGMFALNRPYKDPDGAERGVWGGMNQGARQPRGPQVPSAPAALPHPGSRPNNQASAATNSTWACT